MVDELPKTSRIEAFSDGVIAIVLTIMVLDLKLPQHAAGHGLWRDLVVPLLPKLVPYMMSFLVIAIMWVNHHHLLRAARRAGNMVLWCNNHLLFWMTLIPISTAYLGEDPFDPVALAVYGFVLAATAGAFTLLRWCTTREEHGGFTHAHVAAFEKSVLGTLLYTASIPLAFVSVYLSIAIFVAIPAMFFLPDFMVPRWAAATRRKRGA